MLFILCVAAQTGSWVFDVPVYTPHLASYYCPDRVWRAFVACLSCLPFMHVSLRTVHMLSCTWKLQPCGWQLLETLILHAVWCVCFCTQ